MGDHATIVTGGRIQQCIAVGDTTLIELRQVEMKNELSCDTPQTFSRHIVVMQRNRRELQTTCQNSGSCVGDRSRDTLLD